MSSPDPTRGKIVAIAALLFSMAAVSFGTSLAKHGLFQQVGAEGTSAYRVGFSAILLLAIWRPWRQRIHRRHLLTLLLYGVSLGVMNLLFYLSLRTIPFGIAVALEFVGPLSVAIGTSRRRVDFLWIGLAVIGLALLLPLRQEGRLDPAGVAYALAAGACWAMYILFGKAAGAAQGPRATAIGMSIAAVIIIPVGVAHAGADLLQPQWIGIGLVVAVFSSAIPFSLEMISLRRLPPRTFSVLLSLEPALSTLGGLLILGETLNLLQCVAIAVIMAASIGTAVTSTTDEKPSPTELAAPTVS